MKIVLDVYYNRRKSIIGIKNICGTVSEEIWAIFSFFKQKFLPVKNMCIFLRVKAGFPIRFWLGFVHTCSLLLLALLLKFWWVNRTHKQAYNITIGSFIYKISGCLIHVIELYMAFKASIVFWHKCKLSMMIQVLFQSKKEKFSKEIYFT